MNMLALVLLPAVLLLPLAISSACVVPAMRETAFRLLPLAPLPGLAAALMLGDGTALSMPDMLLGMRLELTANGAIFLGFASLLWIAAGIFAQTYMKPRAQGMAGFSAFWCLTLAGNLGVFIAGDVASFYLFFALVSLAAYPLVVHERTPKAMRAGRIYIVLAVIGETCLLLGFMLAVAGAGGLLVSDMPGAIAALERRDLAIGLLIAGFGLKAGLVPLHMWLPLAHPAAPTPASAVLSGAIVKAGIFGLMQFLPAGMGLEGWSLLLLVAGLFSCWFGILVGLTQTNPKAILAYSTVSQMGIVIAVIGMSLAASEPAMALAAAGLYALHHGLAKGALFMGVGVAQKAGGAGLTLVLGALALVALSVAGLPLTGGALAKLAVKGPLGEGMAETIVVLSAVGTSLLLLRFLLALRTDGRSRPEARPPAAMVIPWVATGLAGLVLPWFLFVRLAGEPSSYALGPGNLWTASWPLLLAAGIAAFALRVKPVHGPAIPEGDLVAPLSSALSQSATLAAAAGGRLAGPLPTPRRPLLGWLETVLPRVEARLANWGVAGCAMLLLVLCLVLVNSVGAG